MARKDLSGKTYNSWNIITPNMVDGKTKGWLCRCSCGSEKVVKNIATVINGSSTSCGCLKKQLLRSNNPMHNPEVARKVSLAHKNDPARRDIARRAAILAQGEHVKKKRIETNLARYGGASPASSSEVRAKMAATNYATYGHKAPAGSVSVIDKMRSTTFDRYGVENIMKLKSLAELISEKIKEGRRNAGVERVANGETVVDECLRLGVLPTTYRNWRREFGQEYAESKLYEDKVPWRSSLEKKTLDILKELEPLGVNVESWNKSIKGSGLAYKPDIKVTLNDRELYLDVDGLYWHADRDPEDELSRNKQYHAEKAAAFAQAGIRLLQFRENEIRDKHSIVLSILKHQLNTSERRFGARKLSMKKVPESEALNFLSDNHMMGSIRGATHNGLWLGNELLCVMSTKFFSDTSLLEIARFAVKKDVSIAGAFFKLLSAARMKHSNALKIVNFVDLRFHTGASSVLNGFNLTKIHVGFEWTDGKNVFNRRFCVADSINGISELQRSRDMGLYKLYDAGQAKYEQLLGVISDKI